MKKTAIAPANIAFIKYWGKKDEVLRLPSNGSISMNLSGLTTTTTVEFSKSYKKDLVTIDGLVKADEEKRVIEHLDRIRNMAGIFQKAKVVSLNSFPASTGLSSSASGFAALTLSAASAAGLNLSERNLSILARLASGSACRSIPSGFVEWLEGTDNNSSYAVSLHPPDFWNIVDIVVIVSREKKEVPTSAGQKYASTSPFFPVRLSRINDKINQIKTFMKEKNFLRFGELVEAEALEMHAIMLTSQLPLIYWQPETLLIMKAVQNWRKDGLLVYFTVNTGQDIHLICEKEFIKRVKTKLKKIKEVKNIIVNYTAEGAKNIGRHLF
ncbi:diphosphomevalonate decarboxylase [Candidatus Gottesmanbacteria bacterium]|nr:diphosphomevalonate decarboxylase [Candidatus Gottesmanbacteria bacterium]MBI5452361.1 diphosphomevalonate decarboxylase [Candidatus Gottesmanbacteria bacterium]